MLVEKTFMTANFDACVRWWMESVKGERSKKSRARRQTKSKAECGERDGNSFSR